MLESMESRLLLAVVIVLVLIMVVHAYNMKKDSSESFEPKAYMKDAHQVDKAEEREGITDDADEEVDLDSDNWNEEMTKMGVDDSVHASHKAFAFDSARTTTTASAMATREYDDGPAGFVGLRRPNYSVRVGDGARSVPSEDSSQLTQYNRFLL